MSQPLFPRNSFSFKRDDLLCDPKCSLSRSVSASGRLGGDVSRNVAAALVPYRLCSERNKLLRMGSDTTFRLSQPAIEMNLANSFNDDVNHGFNNPNDSHVFNQRSINSPGTPEQSPGNRFFSSDRHVNVHFYQPEEGRDLTSITHVDVQSRDDYDRHENHMSGLGSNDNQDHCEPRFDSRITSSALPAVDSDVITMTADRLCVITHGFYLVCCNQSHWDRR